MDTPWDAGRVLTLQVPRNDDYLCLGSTNTGQRCWVTPERASRDTIDRVLHTLSFLPLDHDNVEPSLQQLANVFLCDLHISQRESLVHNWFNRVRDFRIVRGQEHIAHLEDELSHTIERCSEALAIARAQVSTMGVEISELQRRHDERGQALERFMEEVNNLPRLPLPHDVDRLQTLVVEEHTRNQQFQGEDRLRRRVRQPLRSRPRVGASLGGHRGGFSPAALPSVVEHSDSDAPVGASAVQAALPPVEQSENDAAVGVDPQPDRDVEEHRQPLRYRAEEGFPTTAAEQAQFDRDVEEYRRLLRSREEQGSSMTAQQASELEQAGRLLLDRQLELRSRAEEGSPMAAQQASRLEQAGRRLLNTHVDLSAVAFPSAGPRSQPPSEADRLLLNTPDTLQAAVSASARTVSQPQVEAGRIEGTGDIPQPARDSAVRQLPWAPHAAYESRYTHDFVPQTPQQRIQGVGAGYTGTVRPSLGPAFVPLPRSPQLTPDRGTQLFPPWTRSSAERQAWALTRSGNRDTPVVDTPVASSVRTPEPNQDPALGSTAYLRRQMSDGPSPAWYRTNHGLVTTPTTRTGLRDIPTPTAPARSGHITRSQFASSETFLPRYQAAVALRDPDDDDRNFELLLHAEELAIRNSRARMPPLSVPPPRMPRASVPPTGPIVPAQPLPAECAICMEEITVAEAHCRGRCGANVHHSCADRWIAVRLSGAQDGSCAACRAIWVG